MAKHTEHFLVGEETLESSGPPVLVLQQDRLSALPLQALGTGEQSLEELILVAHGDLDVAIAHAWRMAHLVDAVDTIHSLLGSGISFKLDVAVHCFASGALHDNMYRTSLLGVDDPGRATDELQDFLTGDGVGNL